MEGMAVYPKLRGPVCAGPWIHPQRGCGLVLCHLLLLQHLFAEFRLLAWPCHPTRLDQRWAACADHYYPAAGVASTARLDTGVDPPQQAHSPVGVTCNCVLCAFVFVHCQSKIHMFTCLLQCKLLLRQNFENNFSFK